LILKFSRDKLVSQFDHNEISINEEKFREKTSAKKKSVRSANIIKIIRTNNAFSTNMLMFYDNEYENKSLILLFFVKLKNIRSWSIFYFLTFILASSSRNST